MVKFFYKLWFLNRAMPEQLILLFDDLLQMGVAHLKINDGAL